MKWFGLLVAGFALWVLGRLFVPALLVFSLGVALLIGYLYHDVTPLLAVAVISIVYVSSWRGRHGTEK